MRELHVIVHEDAVKAYADTGCNLAQQVMNEIRAIKATKDYLELYFYMESSSLHPNMPSPSNDLQVFVSGGYYRTCCTMQLFELKKAGYNARFHPSANYPGQGVLPSVLLQDILEQFPDFYNTED